ncbi:MAG: YbaB/EbfC family nucleoid-associated protein [Enterobacteriaceae bacterium]|nr:YbaB/EbfC family nucleoid-associated protein [Enterobacteriaceae bacterium]
MNNYINDIFSNISKSSNIINKIKAELDKKIIIGESGAGAIKITGTGNGNIKNINIEESILTEKKDIMEKLLILAMNDYIKKQESIKTTVTTEHMLSLN